jgi:hypothetical protein
MVEKHKMIADFEKIAFSADMLKQCWKDQVENFTALANAGWTDHSIVAFLHYIGTTIYETKLFPGSSLGNLLISRPNKDGYLNYQQTLSISFDKATGFFTLRYFDWDSIDSADDSDKATLWSVKCFGIELGQRFQDFLTWQKTWR